MRLKSGAPLRSNTMDSHFKACLTHAVQIFVAHSQSAATCTTTPESPQINGGLTWKPKDGPLLNVAEFHSGLNPFARICLVLSLVLPSLWHLFCLVPPRSEYIRCSISEC